MYFRQRLKIKETKFMRFREPENPMTLIYRSHRNYKEGFAIFFKYFWRDKLYI